MPKVSTKSLRRLANKLPDSAGVVSGALSESAQYIEELEKEIENIHNQLESYQDKYYSEDVQKVATWILEDSQKRLGIED
ncbi:MAG: hypothetical protein ABS939_02620 [Psychrobacillus sp.]